VHHKRLILSWTIVCIVISLSVSYVGATYPFSRNIHATPVAINGDTITVKGTMDVYFTQQAWCEFGYKKGNFQYFDEWWHQQIGQTYRYMGVHVKLVYIDWTLLQHYYDHDHLGFTLKVKVLGR